VRGETVLKYEVVDSKEARRQPRQNAPLINKAAHWRLVFDLIALSPVKARSISLATRPLNN
jgi:hypothetical protein